MGAYGPASDVPKWLATIRTDGGSAGEEAFRQLADVINHQGSPTPVAVEVVPELIALLDDLSVAHEASILVLLTELSVGGDHTRCLDTGFDAAHPGFTSQSEDHPVRRMHSLVAEAKDLVLARLTSTDAKVRTAAAFAAGFLSPHAAAAEPILEKLCGDEDEGVRASASLAWGYVQRYLSKSNSLPLTNLLADDSHLTRVAAALALHVMGGVDDALVDRVDALLLEELESPHHVAGFPWGEGDLDSFCAQVLSDRAHARRDTKLLWRIVDAAAQKPIFGRAVRALVDATLGEPKESLPTMRSASDLTSDERGLLEGLVERNALGAAQTYLAARGLWCTPADVARFLDPSGCGPLDIEVDDTPLFSLAVAALHADENSAAVDRWLQVVGTLESSAVLALCTDAAEAPYALWVTHPLVSGDHAVQQRRSRMFSLLRRSLGAHLTKEELRKACHAFANNDPEPEQVSAPLAALAELGGLRDSTGLEEIIGLAMSEPEHIANMRIVAQSMTPDALERVLLDLEFEHFSDELNPALPPIMQGGWAFADLCRTEAVLDKMLETIANWEDWMEPHPIEPVAALIASFGDLAKTKVAPLVQDPTVAHREIFALVLAPT